MLIAKLLIAYCTVFVGNGYPNAYSWDSSVDGSSFNGSNSNISLNIYDTTFPSLPPGEWSTTPTASIPLSDRYTLLSTKYGKFATLSSTDDDSIVIGWSFIPNSVGINVGEELQYFKGSEGCDVINLGEGGLQSVEDISSGGGPDLWVLRGANSVRFSTGHIGDTLDNDLVLGGSACAVSDFSSLSDLSTSTVINTSIHMGPGNDLIYIRDIQGTTIDLGMGGGHTDTLDPLDGNDRAIIGGNSYDFSVLGGAGNDTIWWHVLSNNPQTTSTSWPNATFFGAGGRGQAIWEEENGEVDRLVLDISDDTEIFTISREYSIAGTLRVLQCPNSWMEDFRMEGNKYRSTCIHCGVSKGGRRTMILQYISPDETINTGPFYITNIEELQVGVGNDAKVYLVDDINCELIVDKSKSRATTPYIVPELCSSSTAAWMKEPSSPITASITPVIELASNVYLSLSLIIIISIIELLLV